VSELNAFGILIFPKISIILVFLVMAVVLIVRPWGLFGKAEAPARRTAGLAVTPWRPLNLSERLAVLALLIAAAALPFVSGNYALTVGAEIAIFVIFAASLHFLMSVGGLASFGHAAYFGLGAYGVAFLAKLAGFPMIACLSLGPLLGCLGAVVFGFFAVQLSGVYFAMLTLAFAQIVWSIAFQWVEVTGGDNGILGRRNGRQARPISIGSRSASQRSWSRLSASSYSRRSALRYAPRVTPPCAAQQSASTANASSGPLL